MLFNSYNFIFIFLPIVLIGYFLLGKRENSSLANGWMVLASLWFYAYWNVKYLPLLLCSISVNFFISGIIIKARRKEKTILLAKPALGLGIVFNVGLLCFFKYIDFFIENINLASGAQFNLLHIILPLGISFFTITQMVYLVDCYEGIAKEHDLINYSLFVSFFPHLLAGPILHHKPIMKQFADTENRKVNWGNIAHGFVLFVIGLFKKVVIADAFINPVHQGFGNPEQLTLIDSWLTSICYVFQLYFDFSGYSDMAVGIAQMFNIKIPINFNSPYKVTNLINFWSRWHISLTNTITTYLYTPILMSFKEITFAKAMFATFMAMFIAGIWHGAGWTFIIFGTMHAVGLVINNIWKKYKLEMPTILARSITLLWVVLAFVFFRAKNVHDAVVIIKAMFGMNGIVLPTSIPNYLASRALTAGTLVIQDKMTIIYCMVCVIFVSLCPNSNELLKRFTPNWKWAIFIVVILICGILSISKTSEFLYFQF